MRAAATVAGLLFIILVGYVAYNEVPAVKSEVNSLVSKAASGGSQVPQNTQTIEANGDLTECTASNVIAASGILNTFESNTALGNSNFLGKTYCVGGTVDVAVQQDGNGQYFSCSDGCFFLTEATPQLGNCKSEGVCGKYFPLEGYAIIWYWNEEQAAQLSMNESFEASCVVSSYQSDTLTLDNCVLVNPSQGAPGSSTATVQTCINLQACTCTHNCASAQVALVAADFNSTNGGESFVCATQPASAPASFGPSLGEITLDYSGQGSLNVTSIEIVYQGQTNTFNPVGSCQVGVYEVTVFFSTRSHLSTTAVVNQPVEVIIRFSDGTQVQNNSSFTVFVGSAQTSLSSSTSTSNQSQVITTPSTTSNSSSVASSQELAITGGVVIFPVEWFKATSANNQFECGANTNSWSPSSYSSPFAITNSGQVTVSVANVTIVNGGVATTFTPLGSCSIPADSAQFNIFFLTTNTLNAPANAGESATLEVTLTNGITIEQAFTFEG